MTVESYGNKRLFLFAGHYGSGKSEIAVNFALGLARIGMAAIVDFDIINPFFRTAGARGALEQSGVRVIAPIYANTNVDVPALPAEISALFDDKRYKSVFDVGGDSAGAKAVSRYHAEFTSEPYENFFVFNIRRPMTSDIAGIINIFEEIQGSARLPFTSIVNNTNLMSQTREEDLLEGVDAAVELSKRLSLPVSFSAFMCGASGCGLTPPGGISRFVSASEKSGIPIFYIQKHIHMDYNS